MMIEPVINPQSGEYIPASLDPAVVEKNSKPVQK